ncbi:MAG: twin-arginine translocase subunit TatC [Rhodospirillales bacterium]
MKADATTPEDHKMPLLDHLVELRNRMLYCVGGLLVVFLLTFLLLAQDIYNFLVEPLAAAMRERGSEQAARMIFTDLTEVFFTNVKVSFFFAAFVCAPLILMQIWGFVAPGLYKNEKQALRPFMAATPVLFFVGAALVYYLIMPIAWEFFLSFEQPASPDQLPIVLEPKVNEYLSLVMTLIFAFGLAFQLPVIMVLLARVGIVSADGLARTRRYAIVAVVVFAAIFTPPDPLSQLMLAVPVILLYEISIWLARGIEKRRAKAQAQAEKDLDED